MAITTDAAQATWATRFGFLMAAIGSAVGLGNFWRFPYTAGENGGGAFVVVYILCVIAIGAPVLLAELAVGRHAKRSAVGSVRQMAHDAGVPALWTIVGWFGMAGGVLVLCFYSVVAGWVSAYVLKLASGEFVGMAADNVAASFGALLESRNVVMAWHTGFMAVTIAIVAMGVKAGIERAVTILMPLFFIMLIGLVIYAGFAADMGTALAYLFQPDFSQITANTFVEALGQALFSMSVGSAIMITYGAYLPKSDNLTGSAGIVAGADTLVALTAGLAIFPFVFAFTALDPAAGPALLFQAMPAAFAEMPGGQWVGTAFFFLAFIAALTSSISLLQVIVAFGEEHTDFGRVGSALFFGFIIWLVGVACAFSQDFFDLLDIVTSRFLLPLAALGIALFVGWAVARTTLRDELEPTSSGIFNAWRFIMRWPAPIAVALIMISGVLELMGVSVFGVGG